MKEFPIARSVKQRFRQQVKRLREQRLFVGAHGTVIHPVRTLKEILLVGGLCLPALGWSSLPHHPKGTYLALIGMIAASVLAPQLAHALVRKRLDRGNRHSDAGDAESRHQGSAMCAIGEPERSNGWIGDRWIAVAGPMTSGVLALLSWAVAAVLETGASVLEIPFVLDEALFVVNAQALVNGLLCVLNVVMGLPLSRGRGGRTLRPRYPSSFGATRRAVVVGLVAGWILLVMAAIQGSGLLLGFSILLLAVTIHEAGERMFERFVRGRTIRHVTRPIRCSLIPSDRLDRARTALAVGRKSVLTVEWGGEVIGLMTPHDVVRGVRSDGGNGFVAGWMQREMKVVSVTEPLDRVIGRSIFGMVPMVKVPLVVMDQGVCIGIVTYESVMEYIQFPDQALGGD